MPKRAPRKSACQKALELFVKGLALITAFEIIAPAVAAEVVPNQSGAMCETDGEQSQQPCKDRCSNEFISDEINNAEDPFQARLDAVARCGRPIAIRQTKIYNKDPIEAYKKAGGDPEVVQELREIDLQADEVMWHRQHGCHDAEGKPQRYEEIGAHKRGDLDVHVLQKSNTPRWEHFRRTLTEDDAWMHVRSYDRNHNNLQVEFSDGGRLPCDPPSVFAGLWG